MPLTVCTDPVSERGLAHADSRATDAMDRELSTTSRAASSRNSGVKFFFLPAIYTQPFRMDLTGGPQSGRLGAPHTPIGAGGAVRTLLRILAPVPPVRGR